MSEKHYDVELIHALVDGELPEEQRVAVISWISSDPRATSEYTIVVRMKSALREVPQSKPDPVVWERCVGRLAEIDHARRTESFVNRYALAMCAGVFVTIIGGGIVARMNGHRLGTEEMAALSSGLYPSQTASHPSSSSVRQIMQSALGETPVESFGQLQVVGAEAGTVRGMGIARLYLRDAKGPAVLYVIRDGGASSKSAPNYYGSGIVGELNCVTWNMGDCAWMLAANRDTDSLEAMAHKIIAH